MKFFPGEKESSFAFFSLSCVRSPSSLLATTCSCEQAAAQPRPPMRIQGARHTVSWLLDSEKPGGLGSSTRGALSLSVKSIAHGLPIASRAPLAAQPSSRW